MDFLLLPPVTFLIYLIAGAALSGMGRLLAAAGKHSTVKVSTYASGEEPPEQMAAPGYRPFFVVALFFGILHLGILMLGSSNLSPYAGIYLGGLLLALLALIMG